MAFILSNEIPDASNILESYFLAEAKNVIKLFENNYTYGRIRQNWSNGTTVYASPLFP